MQSPPCPITCCSSRPTIRYGIPFPRPKLRMIAGKFRFTCEPRTYLFIGEYSCRPISHVRGATTKYISPSRCWRLRIWPWAGTEQDPLARAQFSCADLQPQQRVPTQAGRTLFAGLGLVLNPRSHPSSKPPPHHPFAQPDFSSPVFLYDNGCRPRPFCPLPQLSAVQE